MKEFDLYELLDAVRAGGDIDVIRRSVEMVLQALIDAKATEMVGAPQETPGENTNRLRRPPPGITASAMTRARGGCQSLSGAGFRTAWWCGWCIGSGVIAVRAYSAYIDGVVTLLMLTIVAASVGW